MSDRLPNALRRLTASWAGQITKLAKSYAPAHLRPYIHSKVEEKDDGTFTVRTTVDRLAEPLPKYGSADARAQEYGSGLQARRGTRKKYPIDPKNTPVLVFKWDKANPNIPKNKYGEVLLHHVEHPGIQAANDGKGYIGPAQAEVRATVKAQLGKEIRDVILGDLKESFGRKGT